MTHADLVARAARWLRYSCRLRASYLVGGQPYRYTAHCAVVFTELATSAMETPDAIGFCNRGLTSVLIECKTSRADFLKDGKKQHRRHCGMGNYRFILAPSGLLEPTEMLTGWGLLSVTGRRVTIDLDATERDTNRRAETQMLWSYCRRMQAAKTGSEDRQRKGHMTVCDWCKQSKRYTAGGTPAVVITADSGKGE